jgi:hypothetical protein
VAHPFSKETARSATPQGNFLEIILTMTSAFSFDGKAGSCQFSLFKLLDSVAASHRLFSRFAKCAINMPEQRENKRV